VFLFTNWVFLVFSLPRPGRVASSFAAALGLEGASLLPLGSLLCYQQVAVFRHGQQHIGRPGGLLVVVLAMVATSLRNFCYKYIRVER